MEAAVISSFAVAAITFVPVQLREIRRSVTIWRSAYRLVEEMTSGDALVFADWMVHPRGDASWAGYPPPPSPDMDDKVDTQALQGPTEREAALVQPARHAFPPGEHGR